MIVSLFYLSLPENLSDIFSDEMVEDFSHIKGTLNMITTKRYDSNTNKWIYLYGFTDNREYADLFESIHDEKLFFRRDKKMTKDEYKEFRSENITSEIRKFNYDEVKEEDNKFIICTHGEEYEISDTFRMWMENMIMESTFIPYSQFKNKYIECLDKLMYCTFNQVNGDDPDLANDNMSYGCTVEGYVSGKSVLYSPNTIGIYIKLFSLLLRKGGGFNA